MISAPSGPRSEGERLVAAYLRQRRFSYVYEEPVGGCNPDFVADIPLGRVALEVFEPHLRLRSNVGSFDSVGPVLGAFKQRKRKQMQAAAGEGLPTVVVIASTNSDIAFDTYALAGAMFGRVGVRFPLDRFEDAVTTFLGPGQTQPRVNTSYSALAAVRRFNPTKWRLEAAWATRAPINATKTPRETLEVARRREAIAMEMIDSGVFDPNAALARLVILHNPFAKIPLPFEFAGLHDDQYGAIEIGDGKGEWVRLAEGRLRREVPD